MSKGGRRVRIFSALEVANICGVVNQTAINWIRNGHLKAFTTPGGQYRIYAKDLAAFLDKRGMIASGEVLQVMMENSNWHIFLIAAEQSVNDGMKDDIARLLPEHTIIQAYDWFEIGRKFSEDKPGYVLLDDRLEGVDLDRFIKTVREDPLLGKPFIILLTEGSSSVQADLILTRPLDLGKLEAAVKGLEKNHGSANSA
jgi:excisionase family DNA binding protein